MKKGLLLAMGAVSFGVAGLASFAPVVSAQDQNTTVTATVANAKSISTVAPLNIDLQVNDMQTGTQAVKTTNNGTAIALTVKAKEAADVNLTNGDNTIPALAKAGELTAGTAAWGYRVGTTGNFNPMTTDAANLGNVATATTNVVYGVATANNQAQGAYASDVVYSY